MDREKERSWFLIGNISEAKGIVLTDEGENPVVFSGAFGFRVTHTEEGKRSVQLIRLNLHSDGVRSERGDTGVIGLVLDEPEYEAHFNARDGSLEAKFNLALHYPLIDEKMGFREAEPGECANFVPYTEVMEGKLSASLPRDLIRETPARFEARGRIEARTARSYVELVHGLEVAILVEVFVLFTPAEILRVQPVFIGSGPCDPTATGKNFDELMRRAHDMWNRCGTVRCISFAVEPPVYVNKDELRVIRIDTEGYDMRLEHSNPNAVEVFVLERMEPPERWGGGACWSGGTASAFIVTSDQQLDVPCPPPCSGGGACGDVNYYHLAHELGHALDLSHPGAGANSTANSVMEPSGFCADNPNSQSARNCRNASNPLLTWGKSICFSSPDIMD